MPEPDLASEKAQEVLSLMSTRLWPDHPPPLELLFKLVGLEMPSELALEVYRRLLTWAALQQQYEALHKTEPSMNGEDPAQG